MYYRRKILLSLIQKFGNEISKIDLQKHLFLLNNELVNKQYDFIPYKFGCFSFQANQDLSTLKKYDIVSESEKKWKKKDINNYLNEINKNDFETLNNYFDKYKILNGEKLIKYVYSNFPYYAINSIIIDKFLLKSEIEKINTLRNKSEDIVLFSIGYEGKSVEYYTNQLIKNNIKILCDIRRNPLSMKYGFSKTQLKFIIENVGIKYIHIPELGIDSNKRKNLNNYNDYQKLFNEYEKTTSINKKNELNLILNLLNENKRLALTCFEADYNNCHRSKTIKLLLNKHNEQIKIIHL